MNDISFRPVAALAGVTMYDEPDVRRQVIRDVAAFYKRAADRSRR